MRRINVANGGCSRECEDEGFENEHAPTGQVGGGGQEGGWQTELGKKKGELTYSNLYKKASSLLYCACIADVDLRSVVWGAAWVLRSQDLKVRRARVVGLASVKCLLEVVGLIDAQETDTLSASGMW